MTIPLNVDIFERGVGGVPSTDHVTNLGASANNYTQTITDQFGFESMQVPLTVSLDEAVEWLQNGLMRHAVVSDPEAAICWEGFLSSVSAQIGQKTVTLSLDVMANRVRCLYTNVLGGSEVTSPVSDANSQVLYGIKDRVVSLNNSSSVPAAYRAAIVLADLAFPKSREASQVTTGAQGDITLTLSFTGWYGVLEWLLTSNSTTSTAVTTTQVGTLIDDYTDTNAFVSDSTYYITASGISSPQKIEANTTYREAIEDRLKLGTGTYPLTWGIYEDRTLHVDPWAGATPTTITYQEYLGDANVYDAAGSVVMPWNVRPNAISQVNNLLDVGPPNAAPDAAARKYVGRVTCTISSDQIGCTLEPSELDSVEVRLAALR
jgi:hypothetical protein